MRFAGHRPAASGESQGPLADERRDCGRSMGSLLEADGGARDTVKVRIVADDREGRSACFRALEADDEVELQVRRLAVGDYVVAERLLVERKTVADLAGSLVQGRLFRQAAALAAQVEYSPCVLLEGSAADLTESGVPRHSLLGALTTLAVVFGLPILRSLHGEESARVLVYAGRQLVSRARGAFKRGGYRPKSKRKIQMLMLQAVPGIGPTRAKALLDAFGTLEALLTASSIDLEAVPGMGPETVKNLRWIVSEPGSPEYGWEEPVL